METSKIETYKLILEKVHQYQSGEIDWKKLIDILHDASVNHENDELISEIYDLIEHEPKKGGFLGINDDEWNNYIKQIQNVLNSMEKEVELLS